MHILFISPQFPPEVNAGASRTYEHCRRWVAAGHRVTVITAAPNWPTGVVYDGYRNGWRSEEEIDGIRVIRVWTYIAANKGFVGRTLNFVSFMLRSAVCATFVKEADVLVATSPHFFSGLAGMLSRWFRSRPFVLEVRDIWPESIVAVGAMKPSRFIRLLERLERCMYRTADHIVTVGNGYYQQLLQREVPAEKITIVPNGVDLQLYQPGEGDVELRRQWNGTGRFVCAYVGTVGLAHGLEVVIEAAQRLQDQGRSDVMFWIVGDGANREQLQEEACRRQLRNVLFTGLIPKEKMPRVIASCDACLVHLRGTELFGTVIPSKIFETMALNTPIIMGVRGQAQDIVLSAGAGVPMTPDDPDSLLESIDTIQANLASYTAGRSYVAERYNRDDLARKMLQTLLEQSRQAKPTGEQTPIGEYTETETRRKAA